jgi:uncharacterized protein (TIGR02271 family)
MNTAYPAADIVNGAEVFGADGGKVGSVAAVYPGYIVVEKGFFFPTDYYIPRSDIASFANGQVYLTMTKEAALHSGWDTRPLDLETAIGPETGLTDVVGTPVAVERNLAGTPLVGETELTGEEEIRIPVIEEELTATVRPQEAGAVRIEKDVVTEQRTLDVPIHEERVRIERRVVDRPVTAADVNAFEDQVIEVPLRTEGVDVQKEARVTGEVIVSKEAAERMEHVSGTVRREEVIVDEEGAVDAHVVEGVEPPPARPL